MPNTKNLAVVAELTEKFNQAKAIYFTDYLGLDVASITELRREFFQSDVEYRVAKNTLVQIAAKTINVENLDDILSGSTALAITYKEPTTPAKILKKFAKAHEKPTIKGVLLEGKLLAGAAIERLADLPSREESLAMLISALQQPLTKLAATLNAPLSSLVNVLNSLKEQKS
ncbi:MAG: 50S ribosomal protein L10 [Candidatus Neomarinimicrobiota bacterium]